MLLISLILSLIAGSFAEYLELGACPNVTTYDYDLVKLSGEWAQYANTLQRYDPTHKCMTKYSQLPEKNVATAIATSISVDTGDLSVTELKYIKTNKNHMVITRRSVPLIGTIDSSFYTIGYDPDSYSLSWNCENRGHYHEKWFALLTRDRHPSKEVLEKAQIDLERNGLSISEMLVNNQEDCD